MAAADGCAGLVLARSRRPDLIVLDVEMPVMGGEVFAQHLRAEFGDSVPPILLISGRDDVFDMAKRLGVDGALCKPFDHHIFLASMSGLLYRDGLDSRSASRAAERNFAGG
jgi:DNA-binding response OmpR family regulator